MSRHEALITALTEWCTAKGFPRKRAGHVYVSADKQPEKGIQFNIASYRAENAFHALVFVRHVEVQKLWASCETRDLASARLECPTVSMALSTDDPSRWVRFSCETEHEVQQSVALLDACYESQGASFLQRHASVVDTLAILEQDEACALALTGNVNSLGLCTVLLAAVLGDRERVEALAAVGYQRIALTGGRLQADSFLKTAEDIKSRM